MGDITQLLEQAQQGDAVARERFFERIYAELDGLARHHLSQQPPLTLLDPSALVREAYLRIEQRGALSFGSRGEFLAYASRAMRCVIIDYVRSRKAQRHGGGERPITLTGGLVDQLLSEPQLESLGDALEALHQIDDRAHRVVEMRFFGGMDMEEIAQHLDVSPATVKRAWVRARAFLHTAMNEPDSVLG